MSSENKHVADNAGEVHLSKLQIIIGSTRPTRSADLVHPWITKTATAQSALEVEVLDLVDWPLPFFSEHFGTIGDINDPSYSAPILKAWKKKIKEGDAYIFVTPEYNHSITGVLKNAFDSVWASNGFRNKPIAIVGYSAGIGGGIRAVEHLAQIAVEAEAVPLRNTVIIPFVGEAFDEAGQPKSSFTRVCLDVLLDDVAWWSTALKQARTAGELTPGRFRVRAAMMADKTESKNT